MLERKDDIPKVWMREGDVQMESTPNFVPPSVADNRVKYTQEPDLDSMDRVQRAQYRGAMRARRLRAQTKKKDLEFAR